MCVCAHSSNWSAKVVECSEPSLGLLIGFLCKTHVCVGSSDLSAHPQLTSCATHVCMCSQQQSVCQRVSIGLFSTRHVCIEKHTHVYAHSSNWSASLEPWMQPSIDFFCNTHMACQSVECSEEPSLGFFIGLACNTNVCAYSSSWSTKQQSVCHRVSIGWFCTRHACVE